MSRHLKERSAEKSNINQELKCMKEIRHNIKELNRSMESIEKMIQRSRDLLSVNSTQPIEKNKIKICNDCSYLGKQQSINPLFGSSSIDKLKGQDNQSFLNTTINTKSKKRSILKSHFIEKNTKSKSQIDQSYRAESTQNKTVYHFSPQKTKKSPSLETKSINLSSANPQHKNKILIKAKHKRALSMEDQKYKLNSTQIREGKIKFKSTYKDNDLNQKIQNNICRTQYNDRVDREPFEKRTIKPMNSKKLISIKLFTKQSEKKRQALQYEQIIKEKGFKVQPPYIIKLKQISKEQQEAISAAAKQKKKEQFIEKIAQYKFVQNYLNKNEIWSIYDRLIAENIPQLKWPIIIVDEVYKKIQSTQ